MGLFSVETFECSFILFRHKSYKSYSNTNSFIQKHFPKSQSEYCILCSMSKQFNINLNGADMRDLNDTEK